MKKTIKYYVIGLVSCLVATAPVVAQTTNNSVFSRFSGSFTSTGTGYQEPYFSIEGFIPFQNTNNNLTFLEGRLLLSTDSTMGGNLLLGHRFGVSDDAVWGGYIAYDIRNTGSNTFNQIGLGLERLGKNWELRTNGYIPLGTSKQVTSESFRGFRFAGNNLLLDVNREFEVALAGFDVEAGVPIARLGEGYVRAYGGMYYYTGDVGSTLGVRGRLVANPTNNVSLGLTLQHDSIFDTRLVFNASIDFAGSSRHLKDTMRLAQSVQRVATISVIGKTENTQELATNPETGKPLQFRYVTPGASTGNGTIENPTDNIQTALNIAQPEDIVYVEFSNSASSGFNIPDNVKVLSNALPQVVETREIGKVQLPNSGGGQLPVVNGTVTMGNNTTLDGFAIINATGNAIQASGVNNLNIRNNKIINPSEQGISLSGVGGRNIISNNRIQDTGAHSIFLQGFGNTQQLFTVENNIIDSSRAQGIFAQASLNSQQQVNLTDNLITDSTGAGIFAQANNNASQTINITRIEVSGTVKDNAGEGGQGIFVAANGAAQQTLKLDNSTISDNAAQGIFIAANSGAKQNFTINNSTTTDNAGQGVFIQVNGNSQQEFTINQITASNTAKDSNGDGGQGIFIAANSGGQQSFTLNSLTITNNLAQGLFISANDGARQNITVNQSSVDSNSSQGIFVQANNSIQDLFLNLANVNNTTKDSNGNGGQGIFVAANDGAQQRLKLDNSTVSNSAGQGVFIAANGKLDTVQTQQTSNITNANINNSRGQGLFIQSNDNAQQDLTLTNSKINDTKLDGNGEGGQGIFLQANGTQQNININNTQITNSAGQGMFVQTNGAATAKVNLNSNTITNSGSNDIFLQANESSKMAALAELNNLENQVINALSAANNSDKPMCLALRNNKTMSGFLLQRNNGDFQLVDLDNITVNNMGTVTFQPSKDNFTNVTNCL
ncbi:MAG: right-handed parallel beta-helix repeat-containing protein [Calothrix sp. C42_A2020_038]|nr:right-handed parallel beta-helix repeat-containing protein [Calothrix sp. C42_A2020_038]